MLEAPFAFLGALVKMGGSGSHEGLLDCSGFGAQTLMRHMRIGSLEGLVAKLSSHGGNGSGSCTNSYFITERGKIAFAIETGRRTKRRYNSVRIAA